MSTAAKPDGPAVSVTGGSTSVGKVPINRSRDQTDLIRATTVTIAGENGPAVSQGKGETTCAGCSETVSVAATVEGEILGRAP